MIESEKEIRSLYGNFTFLAYSRTGATALYLLSTVLTARILSAADLGILSLLVSLVQVSFLFTCGWTSAAVVRFGRQELVSSDAMRATFWSRLALISVGLLLVWIAAFFFQRPIAYALKVEKDLIWLSFFYLISYAISDYGNYLMQAFGNFKRYASSSIVERLTFLVLLSLFFIPIGLRSSVAHILIVMLIAKTAQAAFNIVYVNRDKLLPVILSKDTIRKIVNYSIPSLIFSPTAFLSEWGDFWVIRYYLPVASVGIYQLSYQGLLAVTQLYMGITVLLFPLVTSLRCEEGEERVVGFIKRIIPQLVFIWSLALSFVLIFADKFFLLLFGGKFAGGETSFMILLGALAFIGISGLYSPLNLSYDLLGPAMAICFLTAVINIAFDFALIPLLGIGGAAVATFFAYALNALGYIWLINRRFKLKSYNSFFATTTVFVVLLFCVFCPNILLRLFFLLAVIVSSVIAVRKSGFFRSEDLRVWKRIEKPPMVDKLLNLLYGFFSFEPGGPRIKGA